MQLEYKYETGQNVKILSFDGKVGRINGLYYTCSQLEYYVSFYVDYEEKKCYFYEDDLALIE